MTVSGRRFVLVPNINDRTFLDLGDFDYEITAMVSAPLINPRWRAHLLAAITAADEVFEAFRAVFPQAPLAHENAMRHEWEQLACRETFPGSGLPIGVSGGGKSQSLSDQGRHA